MGRIKKIALFAIAALMVHLTLLYLHHQMMDGSRLMEVHQRMEELEAAPEVLILGNSHAVALQENIIPGSVNLAGYGEQLHQSVAKLEWLINHQNIIPNKLLISCDPGWLRDPKVDQIAHQWYWNQLEDDSLISFSDEPRAFRSKRIITAFFPYMDSEVEAFDLLFGAKEKGEMASFSEVKSINDFPVIRVSSDSCLQSQFSEYGIHYLNKLNRLAQESGIKIYFIRFPLTPLYLAEQSTCYRPEDYYHRLMEMVSDSSVELIDFHDAFALEDFRDPHHLKPGEPRRRLSELVRKSISNP